MADLEYDRHDLVALDILTQACEAIAGGDGSAARGLRTFRRELTYTAFIQAVRNFDALGGSLRGVIADHAYQLAVDSNQRPQGRGAQLAGRLGPMMGRVVDLAGPLAERAASVIARVPRRAAAVAVTGAAASLLLAALGRDAAIQPAAAVPSPTVAQVEPLLDSGPPLPTAKPPAKSFEQTGVASWYGKWHNGKPTATGVAFDMNKLTAAHRSLPLDSRVRVTNLENGKSIELKVNDRGPYIDGRVIDLSMKAAEKLEMKHQGLARVKIEPIP
jgi:rare lipoprotein A